MLLLNLSLIILVLVLSFLVIINLSKKQEIQYNENKKEIDINEEKRKQIPLFFGIEIDGDKDELISKLMKLFPNMKSIKKKKYEVFELNSELFGDLNPQLGILGEELVWGVSLFFQGNDEIKNKIINEFENKNYPKINMKNKYNYEYKFEKYTIEFNINKEFNLYYQNDENLNTIIKEIELKKEENINNSIKML